MEDTLQISAIEKDDSFSILYASLDTAKRDQMDEIAEVGLLVEKLAEVRSKYEHCSQSMAIQLDALEVQHAEESAAKLAEFTKTLKQLQDTVQDCTEKMRCQEAATNAVNETNQHIKSFLVSIRDQIDVFFKETDASNQNAREEVVDVVTVDSGSEDDVSEHENDEEMELDQEQPQAVENNASNVDLVQNGQETHEVEQVQENLSNGDANDQTVKPNDDEGKENARPQSTPIAHKMEEPAAVPVKTVSSVSTKSIIVTIPKVAIPPKSSLVEKTEVHNIDEPGTSGMVQPKKQYECIFCREKFPKKSLVFQHWESTHKRDRKSTETEGKLVRKSSSKRKRLVIEESDDEDADADDDEVPNTNGHYVTAPLNPMMTAMKIKRPKKTKIYYVARN